MSEESNIAATTLLSSFLTPQTTAVAEDAAMRLGRDQLQTTDGKESPFGELLLSNIDGAIENHAAPADLTGLNAPTAQLTALSEAQSIRRAATPTDEPPLPLFPTLSGKNTPQTTPLLPPETGNELDSATGEADQLVPNGNDGLDGNRQRLELHAIAKSDDHINSEPEFSGHLSRDAATPDLEGNEEANPENPYPGLNAIPSGVKADVSADANAGLRRDVYSTTATGGGQLGSSEQAADGQTSNGGEFDQQSSAEEQGFESPLELRANQRAVAEFALNDNRSVPTLGQSSTSSLTSAELGATQPNAWQPGTNSASTGLTPPLTLSADRAVAGQQIAQQVANFIRQGDDFAELNLSPPHLGKISVKITVQNDQASILLNAPSPEIREVIESSLPRLSELLEDAGLNLANADVSHQNQQSSNDSSQATASTQQSDDPELLASGDSNPSSRAPQREILGIIDAYA